MLGRHHLILSVGTVLPFLIPIFFVIPSAINFLIVFLVAVVIGSLTPDADCGGKSKLYYDFKLVYILMKPIELLTVLIFKNDKFREKLKIKEEVDREHRGIMHSPVGILISSFLLTLILSVLLIIFGLFDFIFLILAFFGLVIGQLLHLLEDSCTLTGIDWKFPFGTKLINGNIHIWNRNDHRQGLYSAILGFASISLFLGYIFNKLNFSLLILYPLLVIIISLLWFSFIKISKSKLNITHDLSV